MSEHALSKIEKLEPLDIERLPDLGGRALVRWKEGRARDRKTLRDSGAALAAQSLCLLAQWLALPHVIATGSTPLLIAWFFGIIAVGAHALGNFSALVAEGAGAWFGPDPRQAFLERAALKDAEREAALREAVREWNARAERWNEALALAEGCPTRQMLAVRARLDEVRERLLSAAGRLEERAGRLLRPAGNAGTDDAFGPGARVIDVPSRRTGRVTSDVFGVCARGEVPVAYDDARGYEGTDARRLAQLSEG